MTKRIRLLAGVAPIALTVFMSHVATAGEISGFNGVSGDGYIFSDPDEGVLPPGIKAVTNEINNDDYASENGFAPAPEEGETYNCLMSNNDLTCDAEPGLGKRVKMNWTGAGPMDLSFATTATGGTTEYFTYGKVTNRTGARVMGFEISLGTGTGDDFVGIDEETGVAFDQLVELSEKAEEWPGLGGETEGQDPLQRSFFPDGLFGDGGQEGTIGFFSDDSAGFVVIQQDDGTLTTGVLFNDDHLDLFGDGLLDRGQIPDGYFWDFDADDATEDALIAWYNTGDAEWQYGNLASAEELDAALAGLADALGVEVGDLAYAPGAEIPADILALMEADGAFEVVAIEDLSNLNLNFSLDVSDIEVGGFTLRLTPEFADIVTLAGTDYQFAVAGSLDAANIPYLAADEGYLTLIDEILALSTLAEQQQALERVGYSFLGAYAGLGSQIAGGQLSNLMAGGVVTGGTEQVTQASANRWEMAKGLTGFAVVSGGNGQVDRTANNIGYNLSNVAISAGIETESGLGAMIGYSDATAKIDDGRGSLAADGAAVAVFRRGALGASGRYLATIGYQDLSFDSSRTIEVASVSEVATASPAGSTLFASFQADWQMQRGAVSFGPMFGFDYYRTDVEAFTETGASIYNISVGHQVYESTVALLGVMGSYDTAGALKPYGHLGYAVRNGDGAAISTEFGGLLPGVTPVDGASDGWVDVGIGFSAVLGSGGSTSTSLNAAYHGMIGNSFANHQATLSLTYRF
ncbi:choice-of-anchor F family protein [Actibacterium sp.]|uniref:choice-of-anchor F family protein n=1 Tax=Actibacterium sp. TaxID=1872125 RepID=UPI003566CA6A